MRRKDAYQEVLGRFQSGQIDILLGTQMIAKGLDFPNVTLVGVLNADMEVTYARFSGRGAFLSVADSGGGRAGRGDVPGRY